MSNTGAESDRTQGESPLDAYNKSKEFWTQKEAATNADDSGAPRLASRSSSRALLSRNSVLSLASTPPPTPPRELIEPVAHTTPEKKEKRKSTKRDSVSKKSRSSSLVSSTSSISRTSSDPLVSTTTDRVSEKERSVTASSVAQFTSVDALSEANLSSTPLSASPLRTSGHSKQTELRSQSATAQELSSPLPDFTPSRRRSSSARGTQIITRVSDSPTRLRMSTLDEADWPSTASPRSDAISSPSKRSSSRVVIGEIQQLRSELEREKSDRLILETVVLEHQKLLETLNARLERQSKLILSLQQSIEMFSRPQRIGATPPPNREIPRPLPASEDESPSSLNGPRKSKSARSLTGNSLLTKKPRKGSDVSDSAGAQQQPPEDPLIMTITPGFVEGHPVSSPSPSPSPKPSKRKSKSSKDLTAALENPSRSKGISPDNSSSSIPTDAPKSKRKDSAPHSVTDEASAKQNHSHGSAPTLSSPPSDKADKQKDKERRKSSRKSLMILHDASQGLDSVPAPKSEVAVPSSPLPAAPAKDAITESKKERKKSRRSMMLEDGGAMSDSVVSASPSIHFNSNPSIIPVGTPNHSSSRQKRSKKPASEKKDETVTRSHFVDGHKDALTDVEDYTEHKKKRKIRRTLSDPEEEKPEPGPSDVGTDLEEENVTKSSKSRSKRKFERFENVSATRHSPFTDHRKSERTSRRRSTSSSSALSHGVTSSSPPLGEKKKVRMEGARKDSSASESFDALTTEAAHEGSPAELRTMQRISHKSATSTNTEQVTHINSHQHFRQTSRKLEMEEENMLSQKRRDLTTPRNGLTLDIDRSLAASSKTSDGQYSPSTESTSDYVPKHSQHSSIPGTTTLAPPSERKSTSRQMPSLMLSIASNASASEIPSLSLDVSSSGQTRTQFEQERDSREAFLLSPRGRELSGVAAPLLTARTSTVAFLSSLPSNEIGIPILLEQLCKYLLEEGASCVALFEKRVDHGRLENLRRKLDQTLYPSTAPNTLTGSTSTMPNSNALTANVAKDLKGEDPYVVAGVLKRWWSDLPDSLLVTSKARYWLDVVEITDTDLCIAGLQTLYYSLELNRRRVLRFFIDFLKNFILRSGGITTMEDVCARFGPLLLRIPTPYSPQSSVPNSPLPASTREIQHSSSLSNLSGSTDDTTTPLNTSGTGGMLTRGSTGLQTDHGIARAPTPNAGTTSAAATTGLGRPISRKGSARLELEVNQPEQNQLVALLMRFLITRESEIIKNHDQGVEFARRPDLQYVVRRATLQNLFMLLIDQNYTEREFSSIIWDTCVYFTKPTELLSLMIGMYDKYRGEYRWQARVRMRILMAVKTWVKQCNFALSCYPDFRKNLQQFSNDVLREASETTIPNTEPGAEVRILQSIVNASLFHPSDDTWIQWKLSRLSACEPFTFEVQKHEPIDLAGQLAMIHCRLLSMIQHSELIDNAPLDPESSPNYTGVVQHINCITSWVAYDILCRATPTDRARVIEYYLQVSECLLTLGDFLGCWAIRGAFDLHPVSRIGLTWERVSRKDAGRNKRLAALFEPRMNFVEYRKTFDQKLSESSFAIPILAFLPKDIIRLETNEPTFPETGLVDVDKLRSIYFVLQSLSYANLQTFLNLNPTIKPITTIWDFFANLPVIQESTLEQLSYNAEPRLTVPQSSRRTGNSSLTNPSRSSTKS